MNDRAFEGLTELDTLLLPHNLISEIPANAFQGLIKLEGLLVLFYILVKFSL